MVLALRYGDLSSTVSEANKLATEIDQYCNDLSSKVQQKMYAVQDGMSAALNSADYYVKAKISQLRTKAANARELSSKTQILHDTANRVDNNVKTAIEANQKNFFNKNPELRPSKTQLFLTSFWCDLKNVPLIGGLFRAGEEFVSAIAELTKEIRYWWECGGGQELITNLVDIVVKIGLAAAAVLTFIGLALSGAGIVVLIAAGVLAAIAVINALVNVGTSIQAIQAGAGNPAMSRIYSQRDTLAKVLREENFHNSFLNRLSNVGATLIEATELICDVIMIAYDLKDTFKSLKKFFTAQNRNALGQFAKGRHFTLDNLWKGIKAIPCKVKALPKTIVDFSKKLTIKNLVLGHLQMPEKTWKVWSRLGNARKGDYIYKLGKFVSTAAKAVDSFNDVLKGKHNFGSFALQRLADGVYKNLEISKTFKTTKSILDKIGIPDKLTKGWDKAVVTLPFDNSSESNKTFDYILTPGKGIIEKVQKLIKDSTRKSPRIDVDVPHMLLPNMNTAPSFDKLYPYYELSSQIAA